MNYGGIEGVPDFTAQPFEEKRTKYCVLIPIINEEKHIFQELARIKKCGVHNACDIIICDGGSTDCGADPGALRKHGVAVLLTKTGPGRQSAQLRMGLWWALEQDYEGFITVDGNNKDSVEDIPRFIEMLEKGYDFVQGSRYLPGGQAINTPKLRHFAIKLIHAPVTSLAAGCRFTDSTNGFRAHSKKYITHPEVKPFRDVFDSYELLAYLSVRASQLGLKVCEIPVARVYPKTGKIPTKIRPVKGSAMLLSILIKNLFRRYHQTGLV